MRYVVIILFFIILPFGVRSQHVSAADQDTIPFYRMSLEELMNVNVTVASQVPMSNRETPGIVTIINADEISKSGANDLMQLLRQVPGVDFGVDVEGVVGLGIRGNWAHEGKVLLVWDGMELNEELYSTLQFGDHYPLDQIKKIEIIRGPGSAIYGGNAEYAVINVTTINNSEFNGVNAGAYNSQMNRTFASRGASVAFGKSFKGAHLNLSTVINEGNRSQEDYTDYHGNSYNMASQSRLNDAQYRMDFSLKKFSLTYLYDNYSISQRDGYDEIYQRTYATEFNTACFLAKYEFSKSEKFSLTPGIRFKFQDPWQYNNTVTDDAFEPFSTSVNKKLYYINSTYNPNEWVSIVGGLEYFHQLAMQNFDTVFFSNGAKKFNVDNYSGFAQCVIRLSPINIILGSRYDYNPYYGSSFVPRFGITKVWTKSHIKALYSKAFRAPSIANIDANQEILPERTKVAEIEAGVRLFTNSYLTANVYDISTTDVIVFYYDENQEDSYTNGASTGTRGFDIEYKWKSKGWYAALNYSYYTSAGHDVLSIYSVPGHQNKLLAFPENEFNLNSNVRINKHINVNPSITWFSERYSYEKTNEGDVLANYNRPEFYFNLCLNFEDVFCKGLLIQASCFNLTDEKPRFIQPYRGNHAPLPGQARQFQLKLKYTLLFEGK